MKNRWLWLFPPRFLTFIPLRDVVHCFWRSSLECGDQQTFSEKGQIVNILNFADQRVPVVTTASVALKQHLQYVSKCTCLCSTKILFTKIGDGPDWVFGLFFANPWSWAYFPSITFYLRLSKVTDYLVFL